MSMTNHPEERCAFPGCAQLRNEWFHTRCRRCIQIEQDYCGDLACHSFVSPVPPVEEPKTEETPSGVRVRLLRDVHGDGPFFTTWAPAGEYVAHFNQHGACSVRATNGELLGVKPDEFEVIPTSPKPLDVVWERRDQWTCDRGTPWNEHMENSITRVILGCGTDYEPCSATGRHAVDPTPSPVEPKSVTITLTEADRPATPAEERIHDRYLAWAHSMVLKYGPSRLAGSPLIFDEIESLLASAPSPVEENREERESAWLIELPNGYGSFPTWWDGRGDDTFTHKSTDAVRFARREDAERVLEWIVFRSPHRNSRDRSDAIVTEHIWLSALERGEEKR